MIPEVWQKGRTKGRGKTVSTSCVSRGTMPTSTRGHSVLKDENNGLPAKHAKDGVHPNLDCYKIMEEIILKALK